MKGTVEACLRLMLMKTCRLERNSQQGSFLPSVIVEDIDGTSPNVEVLKLGVGPPSLGEDILGAQTRGLIGHLVVQQDGMLYGQGPEPCVGDVQPVDGRVEHHGPCDAHHSLDALLGYSVVMMGTNTCKLGDLSKVLEMGAVLFGREGRTIVGQVHLWDDAIVPAVSFELGLALHCLVCVEMNLLGNKEIS